MPRRLNNALDAGCVGAMRAAGTDFFHNLYQVAPTLDFNALAEKVGSELKKDLPKKITDAVDLLVALHPAAPKAQPGPNPATRPAGGSAKDQAPAAGVPTKKRSPPAGTSARGEAPSKPK